MNRIAALLAAGLLVAGCGTHRITFVRSTQSGKPTFTQVRTHAHGIGPLLIGGGGYFGVINEMSPALVDYTGPVNTADICPDGFSRVSHGHNFGQSALAGLISWVVIVNAYHASDVEWHCLRD